MTVADDALKALDNEWRTVTEIFARIGGRGSSSGLRHALVNLASQRRVEMKDRPSASSSGEQRGAVYVYRLAQPK